MNESQSLLSSWQKLEYFNPAVVPDDKSIKELLENVPWNSSNKSSSDDNTIGYIVYLGVFNSSHVIDFVKNFFKDESEGMSHSGSNICMASLKADSEGKYIANSICISTLPWAIAQLEKDEIDAGNWAQTFNKLRDNLIEEFESSYPGKLSFEVLTALQNKIKNSIGWSGIPQTEILCKKEESIGPKKKKSDDNKKTEDLLNSFFVNDLVKITNNYSEGKNNSVFENYIKTSLNFATDRIDLAQETIVYKESLTPDNFPDGCWASGQTISLLQQYAVNTLFTKLSDNADIVSLNLPQRQDKSLFLRDMVAAILVKKAKILAEIKEPHTVFEEKGELVTERGMKFPIFAFDESLCQSGIVICSPNNGTIENISKEMPLKKEARPFHDKIGYFQKVAESCIDKESWGLLTIPLGNKDYRNKLITSLWFNPDISIQDLKALLKNSKIDLPDWKKAVQQFNGKQNEVTTERQRLNKIKEDYASYVVMSPKYHEANLNLKTIQDAFDKIKAEKDAADETKAGLLSKKNEYQSELQTIKSTKPGFFVMLFNSTLKEQYKTSYQNAFSALNSIQLKISENQNQLEVIDKNYSQSEKQLVEATDIATAIEKEFKVLEAIVTKAREELKANFADDDYWKNSNSKESQEACPWYSEKLRILQSELLVSALMLQETFILCANSRSQRINSTLSAFFYYLNGNYPLTSEQVKAMWNVLFLVFPVVSTSFASVQSLFKDYNQQELPWLFIDESSRTFPQAAGAVWRSKRTVVIGDEQQFESAETISGTITNKLRPNFKLTGEIVKLRINSSLNN